MLEFIRSGAQSFGVKIAFGIIILVFVFWGVGNFNDRDYSNVVAVVNGEPIVATEFEKAYQNAEEYLMRANPGLTREQLAKDHLGRQVLKDLIEATLLSQEASRAGIVVTPLELRQAVGKIKAFQDESGKFDPEAYKRVLQAQRLSPAQYEKELSSQLLQDKMHKLLTAPVWVDSGEALNMFNFLKGRRLVDYYFIPASRYLDKVSLPDNEMRAWYDENKGKFEIPASVELGYIVVKPEDLVKKEDINAEAAKKWYENNLKNFSVPESVRASHILVPVSQDADDATLASAQSRIEEIKRRLDSGESFARLADEINADGAAGSGGDLGWLHRGETVPSFEEAVFAMTPGTVSNPVRTPFGLHLIYLQEKREPGVKPYEEVKDEVINALAFEEGSEKLHDVLDNLIEDNILNKPLAESAARYGLTAETSHPLDKAALIELLGIKDDAAEAVMATPAGSPLDMALDAGDKYVIARVVKSIPASVKPFDDVKSEIEETLKADKAVAMAMEEAGRLLEKFTNEDFSKIRSEYDIIMDENVDRGGILADFSPDPQLNNAIFEARPKTWLPNAYEEKNAKGAGALLVRVQKIVPPDGKEFGEIKDILLESARQNRGQAIFDFFMNGVLDKAKIEITNQNLIDRVRG